MLNGEVLMFLSVFMMDSMAKLTRLTAITAPIRLPEYSSSIIQVPRQ
jgi:hypothetical protein